MVLVTGANGQLGSDVIRELEKRNIKCKGIIRSDLNLIDENEVRDYIVKIKPNCVIHCAAYTNVDKAEEEKEICKSININSTEYIAKACKEVGAKMIYISSDYVFDGDGIEPFDTGAIKNPLSIYGISKHQGEVKVQEYLEKYFIVRTSWVFGANGNNFVKTMIKLGKERECLNVVSDQIGSPTYTVDLASLLCEMVVSEKYGVYHATNEGYCSWKEFAEEIMKIADLKCEVNPILSSEYKSKATRPLNSRLSKSSLVKNGFEKMPTWKNALLRFIKVNNK